MEKEIKRKLLPVHERFMTFQGEGVHMGKPAFFIRLFGCPVHCPWCDSAGTWHPDYIPAEVLKLSESELAQEADDSGAEIVVITGGEPTIHDLSPLCESLYRKGKHIHLETSGSFPIRGDVNWITCSPKRWKHPLEEVVAATDEFKFIIESPEDIDFYLDLIRSKGYCGENVEGNPQDIWLHPEWTHHQDQLVLTAISDAVKSGGGTFRAGWQLHKLYRVDLADARSAAPAPLGGNPAKGY